MAERLGRSAGHIVTSGGDQGADGTPQAAGLLRDPRVIAAAAFLAFGVLYLIVNAASMIDQRRAIGRPIDAWQAWVLEGTSLIAWLLLLPVVLGVAIRLLPRPLWQSVPCHGLAFVVISCAHTVLMGVMRIAAYALAGGDYAPGEPWSARLLFEARKDVITYVSIVVVYLLARRLVAPAAAAPLPPLSAAPAMIEVREGSRVVLLCPDEIDWVGAAGNYVELHGAFGSKLARRTMADIEAELAPHDFVRVHRSRLVRLAAIAAFETRQSGDFDITLRSGAVLAGSRRFRRNLG